MLATLRSAKFVTSTAIRETNWETEVAHRIEFVRFLREIPQDFRAIAKNGEKKKLVQQHLTSFYNKLPKEHEVETVLERITNLAALLDVGRKFIENKASQNEFKSKHWRECKRCQICGHNFSEINDVTLDHIIPLSLGGAEKAANWQLTCSLCNAQKRHYWGISDLSRCMSMVDFDGSFFKNPSTKIIEQLEQKGNPTRYWVLERENRKCSQCVASAQSDKLFVGPRELGFLLTVDNLTTYCFDCAKKARVPYCKL